MHSRLLYIGDRVAFSRGCRADSRSYERTVFAQIVPSPHFALIILVGCTEGAMATDVAAGETVHLDHLNVSVCAVDDAVSHREVHSLLSG